MLSSLMPIFLVTLTAFILVIAGMAVGVLMGRREISGSCGGLANQSDDGSESACSLCSKPATACSELRSRMQGTGADAFTEPHSAMDDCEKDCVEEGCSKEAMDACKSS
ncbi:MAG: (Na+)-NQR maturation NqrM [Pirellulaceae bacterium]